VRISLKVARPSTTIMHRGPFAGASPEQHAVRLAVVETPETRLVAQKIIERTQRGVREVGTLQVRRVRIWHDRRRANYSRSRQASSGHAQRDR
jgi:hypothetical protein